MYPIEEQEQLFAGKFALHSKPGTFLRDCCFGFSSHSPWCGLCDWGGGSICTRVVLPILEWLNFLGLGIYQVCLAWVAWPRWLLRGDFLGFLFKGSLRLARSRKRKRFYSLISGRVSLLKFFQGLGKAIWFKRKNERRIAKYLFVQTINWRALQKSYHVLVQKTTYENYSNINKLKCLTGLCI